MVYAAPSSFSASAARRSVNVGSPPWRASRCSLRRCSTVQLKLAPASECATLQRFNASTILLCPSPSSVERWALNVGRLALALLHYSILDASRSAPALPQIRFLVLISSAHAFLHHYCKLNRTKISPLQPENQGQACNSSILTYRLGNAA